MTANLGAHEVLEIHEVLNCTIDAANTYQLLRGQVRDPQLQHMMDHQLQFMMNEYNSMVQMTQQQGMSQAAPYRAMKTSQPVYGLDNPQQMSPITSASQMDDRDIASCMLGLLKSAAGLKMKGSLECANPQIRRAVQQAAINCSEQAYEVWQYMNQQGYYQVPTMKEVTTDTMLGMYATAGGMQQSMGGSMNQPNMMHAMHQGNMHPTSHAGSMQDMNNMNAMQQGRGYNHTLPQ
ncbi:spore coat protein [Paenibacillus sambharensis]|uniref:Spore coat protein n=1 Tax=Paenibacillus sambharensis TaxID=1803190 RepID=A0A2W1LMZ5_9BACL|nr:spore coat protein [Paenibacillus sambharensis]PZD96255.1 spore coat protein [Paenibacillus sambharensis]